MIAMLIGTVAHRSATLCIIDVGGVGYRVLMPISSIASLPSKGERVTVYTRMHVRDDGVTLYGFTSLAEQSLFDQLVTVSGVGPKVALAALGAHPADILMRAVVGEDVALISSVPGIGKKTAQRIILELKDKLGQGVDVSVALSGGDSFSEAQDALLGLGYSPSESMDALKGYGGDASDVAGLLRYALKRLGGAR